MNNQIHLSPLQQRMFLAKDTRKLSFQQIGEAIGCDEVFAAAIFYGQAKPTDEQIRNLSAVLNVPTQHLAEELGSHYYPTRGGQVLINSKDYLYAPNRPNIFGDGIMSAIDFKAHVDRVEDPEGDRVKITLDGKFLPYKHW
ncbi:hypothetical protein RO3G_00020 [Rhizopus delemar RA 99-880]|uniref:Cyanate lyase C-terminal domain-containing protein n=1 Tax=Rhizopus delemar (strain RA 99-880 / ATCC MYA-4621 / FGSC 9543 / NRRL 43880) TaxID=246409 RepID=I1BGI6_RHIO9|nr:hypothetical protein RO3G_00020 [Rhizopus delemar RA 99-880]|eukprot:EIE75316.1 hypothetical protein RO3G_00020 [Rhizopus delemar RA 99-880]